MSYLPPTRKEAVIVLVSTLSFLLLTAVFIGLRPEHIAMAVVLDVLLFASLYTRKLVVALLPFVVFAVSYDWMRVWPNYMVNDIDVAGLYSAERTIFGIDVDGVRMTLCEFFHEHHCSVADFFAGLFYLCWVPVPVLFALSLFIKGRRELALRFSLVFLLVNLIGFAGYYIHRHAVWFRADTRYARQCSGFGSFRCIGGYGYFCTHVWAQCQCFCRVALVAFGLYAGRFYLCGYGAL